MARNVIRRLRPSALDELGLSAALEQLVQRQCETANLSCKFDISRKLDHVTGTLAINAYRIVQESLTNVVRHASASHVVLIAKLEQRQVLLAISDNGQGYPKSLNAGFGITGIRERVEGLGGNINTQSEQGQGVKITVSLPLNGKC
jgi:signal transduction histidine kinase